MILRGGAGRKTILLIFQPTHLLYIYYDQYEKIWRKNKIIFFPVLISMELATIFDFRAHTKVHIYNFKTSSSNAVKGCAHMEDIQMKKCTEASLLLLHTTF